MSSLLLIIQPVLTFTVPYFRGRGNKEQCFFLQLLLPIAYCLFSTVVPTAAVCAASCEVAYLSIVSVMAKLTPIKARKPSVNRRNEPVIDGTLWQIAGNPAEVPRPKSAFLRLFQYPPLLLLA